MPNPTNLDKPPSALPAHLTNGDAALLPDAFEARDKKEREKLFNEIKSSTEQGRQPIDFDTLNGHPTSPPRSSSDSHTPKTPSRLHADLGDIEEDARDPRDTAAEEPPVVVRSASPYTQNPAIDFDGLSWPSERALLSTFCRC